MAAVTGKLSNSRILPGSPKAKIAPLETCSFTYIVCDNQIRNKFMLTVIVQAVNASSKKRLYQKNTLFLMDIAHVAVGEGPLPVAVGEGPLPRLVLTLF